MVVPWWPLDLNVSRNGHMLSMQALSCPLGAKSRLWSVLESDSLTVGKLAFLGSLSCHQGPSPKPLVTVGRVLGAGDVVGGSPCTYSLFVFCSVHLCLSPLRKETL